VVDWSAASTNYVLDGDAVFLPDFTGVAEIDAPNHSIKWTTAGGSAQPDLVYTRAFLNREVELGPTLAWQWTIVGPAGTSAVFPVLPGDSEFNLRDGDSGGFDVRVAKVPGGYDAVRANILATQSLADLAIGTSGRAVVAVLTGPRFRAKPPEAEWLRGVTRTRR
jgi:hypothetical protein